MFGISLKNYTKLTYNRFSFLVYEKHKRDMKHYPLECLKYIWVHQVLRNEYRELLPNFQQKKNHFSVYAHSIRTSLLSATISYIYRWTHSFLRITEHLYSQFYIALAKWLHKSLSLTSLMGDDYFIQQQKKHNLLVHLF